MGDHCPGSSGQRLLDRWLFGNHRLTNCNGEIELFLPEQVFGDGRQDGPGFGMLGIGVGKFQPAVEILLVPRSLLSTLQGFFMPAV